MGEYQEIKGEKTRLLAAEARRLRAEGLTLREIGEKIGRCTSRVREYCLGDEGKNWNSRGKV